MNPTRTADGVPTQTDVHKNNIHLTSQTDEYGGGFRAEEEVCQTEKQVWHKFSTAQLQFPGYLFSIETKHINIQQY